MKFKSAIAALIIIILLAGCASGSIGIRSGNASSMRNSAPVPGTYTSSAFVHAEASPNAYFGTLFLGSVMLGLHDGYMRPGSGAYIRKPPEMAEGRAIAERDCSQPFAPLYENLRCK